MYKAIINLITSHNLSIINIKIIIDGNKPILVKNIPTVLSNKVGSILGKTKANIKTKGNLIP